MKKIHIFIAGLGLMGMVSGCEYYTNPVEIRYEKPAEAGATEGARTEGETGDVILPAEEGTATSDEVITPEEYAGTPAPEAPAPEAPAPEAPASETPPVVTIDPGLLREPSRLPGGAILRDPPMATLPPDVSCDENAFAFVSNPSGRDQIYVSDRPDPVTDNDLDQRRYVNLSFKPGLERFSVDEIVLESDRVRFGDLGSGLLPDPLNTDVGVPGIPLAWNSGSLAWHSSGGKVAYIVYTPTADGRRLLWEIRIDETADAAGGASVVANMAYNASDPSIKFEKVTWAGDQLVYSAKDSSGKTALYFAHWDAAGEPRVGSLQYQSDTRFGESPAGTYEIPVWDPVLASEPAGSPIGSKIAFVVEAGSRQIAVCDLTRAPFSTSGTDPRSKCRNIVTVTHEGNNTSPTWSPDGRWIYFVSDRDGNKEIYRVKVDGTGEERLTNDPVDDTSPAVLPVGRPCSS